MFLSTRSLAALASLLFAAGCAAGTGEDAASGSSSDLTAAQTANLSGAFATDSGPIKGLVLGATGNTFVADIDTGVECITAPCPTSEHVVGTFSSTGSTITLSSSSASNLVADQLGTYSYKLVNGVLSLSRGESTARNESSLEKKYSYCSAATDCSIQAIEHARCAGHWDCVSNTCDFTCSN